MSTGAIVDTFLEAIRQRLWSTHLQPYSHTLGKSVNRSFAHHSLARVIFAWHLQQCSEIFLSLSLSLLPEYETVKSCKT